MARRTAAATQTPETDELAQQVSNEVSRLIHELTNENWTEIKRVMDNEGGEIAVSFGVKLTNRPAVDGNVASKDQRISATISFSLGKRTEKAETAFPDPTQPNLPGVTDPE